MFLRFFLIFSFILKPTIAMDDNEEEKVSSATTKAQKVGEKIKPGKVKLGLPIILEKSSSIKIMPNELLKHIFSFLNIDDLGRIAQVCAGWKQAYSEWKQAANDSEAWRLMLLISQGNFGEINQKILGLLTQDLTFSSQEDVAKITYLNDYLVKKNHKGAIERKILWLTKGKIATRSFNSFSGYSIKYYGAYLDRVMNDPSLKHAREPFWAFSDSSPSHVQDLEAAKKLEALLANLQ